MWQKLNILQNDVIKLECAVEYCKIVDSSVVVIKVRHNVDIIWENSGITQFVKFIMWQKLNILQNDVIKLESVVEYPVQ